MLFAAWRSGANDFSDGPEAVANVGSLKKGMTVYKALMTLHPKAVGVRKYMTYSMRPNDQGDYQTMHALTPDQYVVLDLVPARPSKSKPPAEPGIDRWELRDGSPEREDVTIGRALQLGKMRFRY